MTGTTLGPYRLDAELGAGGMGKVFAATVTDRVPGIEEGTRVALKVLHPHLLESPGFFRRFLREAELGASIRHENVVRTYLADALVVDGTQQNFLVMEYVEGQTLRALLDELTRVPEELCRHIGREVAKGLAAIHAAGVVHRDIKPENILISPGDAAGPRGAAEHVVKVMDLGVARLTDEAIRLSRSGMFVGSLPYAAPEQFSRGGSEVDHRADLHALGLVLYELACGRHPFDHDDVRRVMHAVVNDAPRCVAEINPQLSPFFEEVVHKLVAKERDARFPSAALVAQVLDAGEESAWWKGHAQALRIETRQPLRRIHVPRETALYGRDGDLDRLRSLYGKAQAGDGQVLLLEGEAGIGKTRLVDEFVARLRQDGEDLNFLFGSYAPGGAATAAGAFSTAYREQFGSAGLTEVLATYLAPTPALIPAFAALLRGEPSPEGREPLTKDSLQTVFVHATRGLASERTTIVLIDDLHFAPEDGRSLFAALSMGLPGHRVLLVGTARPGLLPGEWTAELERREHASRLQLQRLGPKDMTRLLEDTLRSARLAEELAGKIGVKSDGNPFFVFEILRGLREGQLITRRDDGTWASTQVIEKIRIPSSVMDLVNARVADLGEAERDVLDVAACCGFEFDPLVVGEVVGMSRIPLLKCLGHIERRHRLVRSAGVRCRFDHHQVQEALYDGLSELLRREYHAAIAEALLRRAGGAETDPATLDGERVVELAEHFFEGARGEQGLRYLAPALAHLDGGYLSDSANTLADRALAVPGLVTGAARIDLLLGKAARLGELGRRERERAALEEARALDALEERPRDGKVARAFGWHLVQTDHYEEALDVLEEARDQAERAGNARYLAQALNVRGLALRLLGRVEESRAHHERALDLFASIGDQRGRGQALGNLGLVHWAQGRLEEAKEHFRRNLASAAEVGDPRGKASGNGNLGLILQAQGRPQEARVHYERSLSVCREAGLRVGEGITLGNLGNVHLAEGRLEQARRSHLLSVEIAREVRNRGGEAISALNVGLTLSLAGDDAEARRYFAAGASIAGDIGAKRIVGGARCYLGIHALRHDERDEARSELTAAVAIGREIGDSGLLAESLLWLGAVTRDEGDVEGGSALIAEALDVALESGTPGVEVLARAQLTSCPGGDVDAAQASLRAHEHRIGVAQAAAARFLLFRATGDPTHLAEARRRLMDLREHAGEAYRASILEVAIHRDIVAAWDARSDSSG